MKQVFAIAGRVYRAVKPVRDPEYRRWIKSFPCCACGASSRVEPCHTGPHGLGQKASDHTCIPLCRKCHELMGSCPAGIAHAHGIDVDGLTAMFQRLYACTEFRKKEAA